LFGEATALSRVLPSVFPPHLLSPSECETTRSVDQVTGGFFLVLGAAGTGIKTARGAKDRHDGHGRFVAHAPDAHVLLEKIR
jgi:hypothetical protein